MIQVINNDPAYYAIIPANVRYDKKLSFGAKFMYGEITALSNKYGFCFATNSYFAGLYEKSEDTISRWVSELRNAGYIIVKINQTKGNERTIFIAQVSEEMPIPTGKNADTYRQKSGDPTGKNADYNNTSINTTINRESNTRAKKNKIEKPCIENSNLFRRPTIPTIDQVKEVFARQGGTDEMAIVFFEKNSAVDWFNRGSPITKFSYMVPSFIESWKLNEQNNAKRTENNTRNNTQGRNSKSAGADKFANRLAEKFAARGGDNVET